MLLTEHNFPVLLPSLWRKRARIVGNEVEPEKKSGEGVSVLFLFGTILFCY